MALSNSSIQNVSTKNVATSSTNEQQTKPKSPPKRRYRYIPPHLRGRQTTKKSTKPISSLYMVEEPERLILPIALFVELS